MKSDTFHGANRRPEWWVGRISANIGLLWPELSLLDRIAAAGAAGFAAVEFHWPYDIPAGAVATACAGANLQAWMLNTVPGDLAKGELGLAAIAGARDRFRATFLQSVSYARTIGAGKIHVMAGNVTPDGAARDTLTRNLKWALDQATDMVLLLEPLNRTSAPGYFYHHPAEAAAIISQVGSPRLQLLFDLYHIGMESLDVDAQLACCADLIGHVQVASVPKRMAPAADNEIFTALLRSLGQMGYKGLIGCEYQQPATECRQPDWNPPAG